MGSRFQSISPPNTINTMCTNILCIVIITCFTTGLATPARSRPVEGQKFNSQLREKFIYGHDDEPDYNSDHSYPVSYEYESYQHNEPQTEVVKEKFMTEEEQEQKQGFNFGTFHHGTHSAQSQTETEDSPSMREFTLIISRLLFHLSQM